MQREENGLARVAFVKTRDRAEGVRSALALLDNVQFRPAVSKIMAKHSGHLSHTGDSIEVWMKRKSAPFLSIGILIFLPVFS